MTSQTRFTAMSIAAGVTGVLQGADAPADRGPVAELIARIKNPDETVNGPAWQSAETYGAAAVEPLAALLADSDFEAARRAKRALYRIVHHVGRPGAKQESRSVEAKLVRVLRHPEAKIRREALWMLSDIGSDQAVGPMAALLADKEVAEDARCALMRIPGSKATSAMKLAMASAPEKFKFALADGLRKRGEQVEGYPTQKLVPCAQTTVVPFQPKAGPQGGAAASK